MPEIVQHLREQFFAQQDLGYRDFISRLIPTMDKERIIGLRTPAMKAIMKTLPNDQRSAFLDVLPHHYYEEDQLHAALISLIKDYDEALWRVEAFLPHVDNWATCDTLFPKALLKRPEQTWQQIQRWIAGGREYHVRFGVVSLMGRFLDTHFQPPMLALVAGIRREEYYINMAIAWYLSMALVDQYELTLPLIESGGLDKFVHNKAIQKAVESRQISEERKALLKTLRRR